MAQTDKKYRLYALHAGDRPSDAEFYFLLPDIDLVYTQEAPKDAIEIKATEQIPAEARGWLLETIDEIAARFLRENEEAILDGSKTFMDRFAAELEQERRRTAKTVRVKARAVKHAR